MKLRASPALLLALFIAACGPGDSGRGLGAAAEQIPEAERFGGTAVILHAQDFQPINPLTADIRPNLQLHQFALFTPLLRYDAELNPLPALAERWDTVRVTPDTLELTFHLRRDVFWHDGTQTTADDVLFTFERSVDPRAAIPHIEMYRLYSRHAERVDSFTVRFRVRASPDFLVPWMTRPPVPRHLLGNAAPEEMYRHPYGQQPVGNGPFRFVRRTPGQEWVFEANPEYPQVLGGRPYLDRLVVRVLPDPTARLTEILSGAADVTMVPFNRAAELEATPGVRLFSVADGSWDYLGWNLRLPLFQDARVRRALTLALDREAIAVAVTEGHGEAGRTTVTPVHWAYDASDPSLTLPHDPEQARRLLAEAGWRDRDGDGIVEDEAGRPFRFTIKFPGSYDTAREAVVVLQSQLRQVGVDARLQQVEMNTLIDQLVGSVNARGERVRDYEAVVFGWVDGPFTKDDGQYLHSRVADEPNGQAGYSNPRADVLLDSLRITVDREAARSLWREYQRLLAEEQPYTVLYYPNSVYAARARLHGVEMDRRGFLVSLARWWIPPNERRAGERGTP